jgi:hypothetical protein
MAQTQKLQKKGGSSFRFEVDYTNPSILNDYKKLANNFIKPADIFGYLPLIALGITSFGTYYFYKKNKLKTAAVFGAPILFIFSQPIIKRLTPKRNIEEPRN